MGSRGAHVLQNPIEPWFVGRPWTPLGEQFFGTFWCYFLVLFLIVFLEAILSEIVAQRLSKGAPGVSFGTTFVHFFRLLAKVKIELSPRREPHF